MFGKTLKTLLALSVFLFGALAIGKIAIDAGIWIAVEAVLALVSSFAVFVVIPPSRHGACIANVWGGYRAVGPGVHFLFRPCEWVDKTVEVRKFEIVFVATPDTAGRDVASVRVVVGCEPSIPYLPEYLRFDPVQRDAAVKSRTEGLLTKLGHLCGSFDAIYAGGDDISAKLMLLFRNDSAGGMSLEEYYGLKVNYIFLADITPPEIVRDAAARKRVAEERVKTLQITVRGYEDQITEMVANEPGLSRSQARRLLMAETRSIPQTTINHVYEAGPDFTNFLGRFLKGGRS